VSSYRDYVDILARNRSFDGLAAFTSLTAGFATDPTATPKLKIGLLISGNLLPLMGVEPTIGRAFRPEEDEVPRRDVMASRSPPGAISPAVMTRTRRASAAKSRRVRRSLWSFRHPKSPPDE
jgi:hypothetical protein